MKIYRLCNLTPGEEATTSYTDDPPTVPDTGHWATEVWTTDPAGQPVHINRVRYTLNGRTGHWTYVQNITARALIEKLAANRRAQMAIVPNEVAA